MGQLIAAVFIIALLQWACCSCKYILVKLLPLGGALAIMIWCSILEAQRTQPGCGMGNGLLLIMLIIFLSGIVLGWAIHAATHREEKNKEQK